MREKLLLFTALAVLVPGALLVVIAERSSSGSLERVIGRQLAREAGHTAGRLTTLLRSERDALENFARQDLMREIRVTDIDKRISLALTTLREGSPARIDYAVFDSAGSVVASSNPVLLGTAARSSDGSWSVAGLSGSGWTPIPGAPSRIQLRAPVHDPDDATRRLGTLVGVFDWRGLTQVTERVRDELAAQGVPADVLVTVEDGVVIAGARSSRGGELTRTADIPKAVRGIDSSRPDYTVDDDSGAIIGRASLAPELPGWGLLILESHAAALAPARHASRRLAVAMGIALVFALGMATLAARRVVRPLSELTLAIRALARPDRKRGPVPVRSQDELGTLATAFNRMSADLERAQNDLVEAEKFALVGELAAGVAHEIRTALNVLGSSAQILERSLPDDAGPESAELAEMIRAEVGRLASVVNDLLTLARGRPLVLESLRLSATLARAVDFVAAQARDKDIEIQRSAPEPEPLVSCDSELIYQVAVNLLVNAIQAIRYGGCIEVEVLDAEDGLGGFEVRDDGPGIPEPLGERIFDPFVTGRNDGVGLGLTYVKRVVHDHRGSVRLESTPPHGTAIEVRLPLAEVSSAEDTR